MDLQYRMVNVQNYVGWFLLVIEHVVVMVLWCR